MADGGGKFQTLSTEEDGVEVRTGENENIIESFST